jgi:3-isopropylmalate/(R)-2-methylmalate dehydratase large subunit
MIITEKILAKHAGKTKVEPGENIWINVDILMTHDVCGPGTVGIFKKHFGENAKVWDRDKIVIIPDHYIFTKNLHAKRNVEILRQFVDEQKLIHYYDVGTPRYKGVCHVTMSEEGFNVPCSVIFGTDSHTCTAGAFGLFATGIGNTDAAFIMGTGRLWVKVPQTMLFILNGQLPDYIMAKDVILKIIGDIGFDGATYRSMEFEGTGIQQMNMEERMTLCNMVIEAGAKNGIIAPDQTTFDFMQSKSNQPYECYESDKNGKYFSTFTYQSQLLEPMVAKPYSPENVETAKKLSDIKLNQCYIGSCTGGKITDFKAVAGILKGNTVKVKTCIVPATTTVDQLLSTEQIDGQSLQDIFIQAGAQIGPPSCAACLGGPEDTFGRLNHDEVCISTTNRNFPGRMGTKGSKTYLASPLTAAASALTGRITDPREYLR